MSCRAMILNRGTFKVLFIEIAHDSSLNSYMRTWCFTGRTESPYIATFHCAAGDEAVGRLSSTSSRALQALISAYGSTVYMFIGII